MNTPTGSAVPGDAGEAPITDAMVERVSKAIYAAIGVSPGMADIAARTAIAALVAPAPVGVNALTDAQIKDATTEYLSHRGERPYRILRGGQALWEVHMPAMQVAIRSALTAGEPALPGGDDVALRDENAWTPHQQAKLTDFKGCLEEHEAMSCASTATRVREAALDFALSVVLDAKTRTNR